MATEPYIYGHSNCAPPPTLGGRVNLALTALKVDLVADAAVSGRCKWHTIYMIFNYID